MVRIKDWALTALSLISTTSAQSGPQSPAKSYPKQLTLSYQHLHESTKHPLATIDFDPSTLENTLSSWTPPLSEIEKLKSTSSEPTSSPLLRILYGDSSSVTGLASLDPLLAQDINIIISPAGELVSAHINARTPPPLTAEEEQLRLKEDRLRKRGKPIPPRPKKHKSKKERKAEKELAEKGFKAKEEEVLGPVVTVNIAVVGAGPQPRWNSRVVKVDAVSGKEVEEAEVVERSFLQKYWYIILAVGFVLLGGGGGGK